jgi:RNA polymerase sigma-70 factor (ECF subfamily)
MSSEHAAAADDTSPAAREARSFTTTHWSLVVRAGSDRTIDSRDALEELCRKYWPPLYRFARRRGYSQQDAEDLTQGFFADLLESGSLARADSNRGRFRTFLLASFQHYQSHQRERAATLKRGGGRTIVSLDALRETEDGPVFEPPENETPEKAFDRSWALSVLDHALEHLRRDYAAVGKEVFFDGLKGAVWGGGGDESHAELARRLHSTEGAIRVAVHRLRRRFREELRAEVAATLDDPAEVDDELRHLLSALGP